ncbi:Down syndrome cell adhesion molecule-like [Stylophora pistillata]|uniref:Down syndrome cell adhesion molecule-like n=1 Tax=Stylophora pistillata TaxID=50429 RepID=A0A2B4SLZ4_STYPI|nr:Down syndrome cell adhesion molecule-like [Stylophora pistillata]
MSNAGAGGCVEYYLGMQNGAILDNEITASSVQNGSTPAKNGRASYTSGSSWCAGTACDMKAIGLADGGKIPDSSFTATSIFNDRYRAQYGRLNKNKARAPKDNNNTDDFVQIDLLYEYIVCAVATLGNPTMNTPEWTTHYRIHLSLNDTTFDTYKESNNDKLQVFPGNKNKDITVKHGLNSFASAKYIRFVPTQYHVWKILRVEVYGILLTKVPSQHPASFNLTASSSTSITAYWQLPPVFARHGKIDGFKLFYREKCSAGSFTFLNITNGSTLRRLVTGLDKYTEYEFQVLAYTSGGDGPKSSVEVERTMENVPSLPPSGFTLTATTSSSISGSWQLPPEDSRNGMIKGFKLFYKKKGSLGPASMHLINNQATCTQEVTGLRENTEYEFQILPFTSVGDGPKSTALSKKTKETVPPKIIEELSPSSVMCKKQTPCLLSCQATSYIPLNFSWTKDGQVPMGDNMKLFSNSIIVTPRDGRDYGDYVCHATNSFGSTEYKITLLAPTDNQIDDDTQSIFFASVIALSCIVVVLLIIICGLIWQYRRAVHYKRIQRKQRVDFDGVKSSHDQQSSDEHASDPNTYMELKPWPSTQESEVPTEYQSLQEKPEKQGYYNVVLQKESGGKRNEEVYEEI